LIVFIHGGAWRSNSPDQFSEQASLLFDHAAHPDQLAVAIPAYRLSLAPDWPQHPAHLDDLTQALTHLSSQGVTRLHLIGHSCGATLAAQLTLDHRIPPNLQLQSVAGIEGIYDLPALVNDFPSYADHFVNDAFGKDPAQWTKASPAHMILSPSACFAPIPWLLIQSMEDELINLTQTSLFAHALAQAH
ncbi:Alpha/Beta hydrolase protein, partial [Piptocephalis cylindrospora]